MECLNITIKISNICKNIHKIIPCGADPLTTLSQGMIKYIASKSQATPISNFKLNVRNVHTDVCSSLDI